MPVSRRDFMKMFGIGVASILMTRCRSDPPVVTCYTPMFPTPQALTPRQRLRQDWLSFGELAQRTRDEANQGSTEGSFSTELSVDHRTALEALVTEGQLSEQVADLVQEGFDAAVYHVWRSNSLMTCYEPVMVDYAPASADVLVQQAGILDELSAQGSIDPETLARARTALEHDLAYYALSEEDLQVLYADVIQTYQQQGTSIPSFAALELEVTPDAREAAAFIIDLLTGK